MTKREAGRRAKGLAALWIASNLEQGCVNGEGNLRDLSEADREKVGAALEELVERLER